MDKRVDLVLEFQVEEAVTPRIGRLAIFEEHKSMPWATVWEYYCASQGVAEGIGWLEKVRSYEKNTLCQRGGAQ
ncbi:MAG: L-rhamnose isomerase [Terracidiphilus sp.]